MRFFTCVDHDCHYPVGVASIVFAETKEQAQALLDEQLRAHGLKASDQEPYLLVEYVVIEPMALVLRDGEY